MADPRRLGKRGAYRLGELRAARPRPRARARPREPSFRPRRSRGALLAWLAACAVTAALLGLGAGLGWWFLPFAAGIAAGAGPGGPSGPGPGGAGGRPGLGRRPLVASTVRCPRLGDRPGHRRPGRPAPHAAVGVAATVGIGVLQVLVAFWLARAVTYRLR